MEKGPKMTTTEDITKLEKSREEALSVAKEQVEYYQVEDPVDVLHEDAKLQDEMRKDFLRGQEYKEETRAREEIANKVATGEQEVPEKIKQAVKEASDLFWKKFDDYVRAIQSGQKAESPSRNKHILLYSKDCESQEDIANGYWKTLFDQGMEKRGILNITPNEMNQIMYEGVCPESLKLPEQK